MIPERDSRGWMPFAACVAFSLITPFLSVWVVHNLTIPAHKLGILGLTTVTGSLIGVLVGIRRCRLAPLVFGFAVGFLIGWLDVRVFAILLTHFETTVFVAALCPVFGIGFGVWIALYRSSYLRGVLTVIIIASSDVLSRLVYISCVDMVSDGFAYWQEGLAFVLPTALIVSLTPPVTASQRTNAANATDG